MGGHEKEGLLPDRFYFLSVCGVGSLVRSKVRKAERPGHTEVGEGKGQGEVVKGAPGGLTWAGFSARMMPTGGVEKTLSQV